MISWQNIGRVSGVILCILSDTLAPSCKKEVMPALITSDISNITESTATSGGSITDGGSSPVTVFGVCWSTDTLPSINDYLTEESNNSENFTCNLTGLSAGTEYHIRAYATNGAGTAYGTDKSFRTLGQSPTPVVVAATDIKMTNARLNGLVNSNYLSSIVSFEYGLTISYGSMVTAEESPVTGNTNTNIKAVITGLNPGSTYHYRIKAQNSLGINYSNDMSFMTISSTVTDVESFTYDVVEIGTQIWMKENLRTTRYSNGDIIGTTNPATMDITNEITPKYQWPFAGYEGNVEVYGRLYTWYAITDSRNICPGGWHVSTENEWVELTTYIGGEAIAGTKLKSVTGWLGGPFAPDNSSGFSALPEGIVSLQGDLSEMVDLL